MIKQLNSDEIRSINNKGRDLKILNMLKTGAAFLGLIAWILVCWILLSGRAAI
jgi:hypothetical protein